MYINILLELKNKNVDQTFTYQVPLELQSKIKVGKRVKVPFNKRILEGFILEIYQDFKNDDNFEVREILEVVDEEIVLTKDLLDIAYFIKDSTLCSLSSAIQTMLPKALKASSKTKVNKKYQSFLKLKVDKDVALNLCKNKIQEEIIKKIILEEVVLKKDAMLISNSAVNTLLKKEILIEEKKEEYRLKENEEYIDKKINLTDEQKLVFERIKKSLNTNEKFLLHGVTGSGKTEIYMHVIAEVLNLNKTAIVLVPEISLTPQFVLNFKARFKNCVAVLHSGLSDGEKYDEWRKIVNKEAKIVIGARSAVFAPLLNLGIIIVDEEHSESYKQENNPRYNAIEVAVFRSQKLGIPLILGSATPSLEKMARARKGLYTLLELPHRVNNKALPNCEIIDMAKEIKKGNYLLSDRLKLEIESAISRQEQIILLLNRRGFATNVSCSYCGFTYKCPHCEITLTYHKSKNTLRCHYCGYTIYKNDKCPNCQNDLNLYGTGTEKLESILQKEYSDLKIIRMDADTTQSKNSHEQIIKKFKDREYDILVGTQMISKGLDFENVSVVGIINADMTLNVPDFRSGERTFDLLYQTAGRAGRSKTVGNVIIQTFNPNNFILKCVEEQSYEKFYNYEMQIRKKLKYPPFYYLVSLKVASKDYDLCSKEASKICQYLKNNISEKTIVLGPTTANVFKMNNVYRFGIILKYRFDDKLMPTLKELDKMFVFNNKVNLEIDIHPTKI